MSYGATATSARNRWVSLAPVATLVAVYLLASLSLLAIWSARDVYSVTGDEPHYLVMADSLISHHSLELSDAYRDEFAGRAIFATGLGDVGSPLEPPYAHTLLGSHGSFSWHGPGVSMLVAVPFALGGTLGAKIAMVLLGALAVVLAWRISAVLLAQSPLAPPWRRFWAVLAIALGYPLIGASTQVYPDLLAGTIALGGVWLLLTPDLDRRPRTLAAWGLALSFLPWLGTKFVILEGVLLVGVALQLWPRRRLRAAHLLWPAALSFALLLAYNSYAFGRLSGPPAEGALEASRTSFMVLWGLLLDQDEGSLLQNPGLLLALVGLVPFVRRFRYVSLFWALAFASLWLPSAMHTGWYGLGSFVGRYSWAMSLLLLVPAFVGFRWIAERSSVLAQVIAVVLIGFHAITFAMFAVVGGGAPGMAHGLDLYTKAPGTWLESYSIVYFPLQNWVPALYNDTWAYTFLPNLGWLLAATALIIVGWRWRTGLALLALSLIVVLIGGLTSSPGPRTDVLAVDADAPAAAGFFDSVLIRQMRQGPYRWSVTYSSAADAATPAGEWQLVRSGTTEVVASGQLPGTSGQTSTVATELPFRSLRPTEFFLRVAHYGEGAFTLEELGVQHS